MTFEILYKQAERYFPLKNKTIDAESLQTLVNYKDQLRHDLTESRCNKDSMNIRLIKNIDLNNFNHSIIKHLCKCKSDTIVIYIANIIDKIQCFVLL